MIHLWRAQVFFILLLNSRLLRYLFVVVPCEPKPCDIDPFPPLHIRVAYLPPILVDVFFINNIIQYNTCILFRKCSKHEHFWPRYVLKNICFGDTVFDPSLYDSQTFCPLRGILNSPSSLSKPYEYIHPPPPTYRRCQWGGGGLTTQCAVFMNIYPLHTWGYRKPLITYRFHLPEICLKFKKLNTPSLPPTYYLRICTPYQLTDWLSMWLIYWWWQKVRSFVLLIPWPFTPWGSGVWGRTGYSAIANRCWLWVRKPTVHIFPHFLKPVPT